MNEWRKLVFEYKAHNNYSNHNHNCNYNYNMIWCFYQPGSKVPQYRHVKQGSFSPSPHSHKSYPSSLVGNAKIRHMEHIFTNPTVCFVRSFVDEAYFRRIVKTWTSESISEGRDHTKISTSYDSVKMIFKEIWCQYVYYYNIYQHSTDMWIRNCSYWKLSLSKPLISQFRKVILLHKKDVYFV